MKKIWKALVGIFAAVAMAVTGFAGATTAFAAGEYTITIDNEKPDHTYQAYQVFSGNLSGDVLSNIAWGSGVKSTEGFRFAGKSTAAEIAGALTNENAKDFADAIAKDHLADTPTAETSTQTGNKYVLSGLNAGYYLIRDKDNTLGDKDDAYTSFILKVVKNQEVKPKSEKPTVDKQVQDETADAEKDATDGWGETADHAINESFKFKLTATIPADANMGAYKQYKIQFNDTMSEGVTFESIDSVKVKFGDGEPIEVKAQSDENPNGYVQSDITTNKDKTQSWSLSIADIKKLAENVDLTKGATVEVIYNAHLNEKAQVNTATGTTTNENTVNLQYSNNPNVGGEGETGKTPDDHVWVFTYEMDNTKVDASNDDKPLGGAGFKLYQDGKEVPLIYDEGLSAYRPTKGEEKGVEMFSAKDTGKFNIKGLDAGTYVLKETTTPDGYNTMADKTLVISADHAEATDGNSATTTLTRDTSLNNTIENEKGSSLPETGGMGTTILYAAGAVLVIAAAAWFGLRRKASAAARRH